MQPLSHPYFQLFLELDFDRWKLISNSKTRKSRFCFSGEHYLGYKNFDLKGVSYYDLLHPECTKDVQTKHRLSRETGLMSSTVPFLLISQTFSVTQSESERSCILLLRLQKQDGSWIWCHTVIQVRSV